MGRWELERRMGEERESEEGRSARGKTSGGEGSGRRDDILSWQGREGEVGGGGK